MRERKVYGIGETICDIIFEKGQPQTAKAGGSSFNALVSLGRAGVATSFISKLGDDILGRMILDFMHQNHIASDNVNVWKGHQTDVALAFLDDQCDAQYSFYKSYDKQFVEAKIPSFQADDILLFGSYFALSPMLRPLIESVLEAAHKAGCIIYYDPNFRSSHLSELDVVRPVLYNNFKIATIVRGSDEDFLNIFGENKDLTLLKTMASPLIITKNSAGVTVVDRAGNYDFPAQPIVPVSTIGAGDSFNAGFIYALLKYDIRLSDIDSLTQKDWEMLITIAVDFSTAVCQSYDNYIPEGFLDDKSY